jgi:acetoin utilization protein AcuC
MAIGILWHEELKEYDFGPGHPFRGGRYEAFLRLLQERVPEENNYRLLKAAPATEEDLLLICTKDYIEFTREYFKAANLGLTYPGPFSRYHSMDNMPIGKPGRIEEAARLVVGQAKLACDLVQGGAFTKVVSVGGGLHHAKPDYGEGFCLYNDVAFCGRYLIEKYGLERIVILDTDAHGGNGTMEYFYDEPRVLFIDLHQDPRTLYPGTGFVHQIGSGAAKGYTVNIPMPVGAGYESYKLVFESIVEPLVQEFRPQVVIRNGGSDPHFSDQLTALGLSVEGFRMIGEKVREIAAICNGKVIDLIASGYNEKVSPYAWLALLSGLAGWEVRVEEPVPVPTRFTTDATLRQTQKVVQELKNTLKPFWTCLN